MKTIFLINSLDNGGAEKVLKLISEELTKTVTIYTLKKSEKKQIIKGVKIKSFSKSKNNIIMLLSIPLTILRIKKLAKTNKIISFLELSNFLNIISNKNAIISFRTSLEFFNKGMKNKIQLKLIKKLYPKAKLIIVNSKENAENIINQLKITKKKIKIIKNPLNNKEIEKLKKEKLDLKLKEQIKNKTIFITHGRLVKEKNHEKIIKGFNKIKIKNKILLILNKGPEKERLIRLVKKLKLNKQIIFIGEQKNVYKFLNMADFYLYSSEAEGYPNSLIEANYCNLPILTNEFKTGAKEIIDPDLKFNKKITYPYKGPNGILIKKETFCQDIAKIKFSEIKKPTKLKEHSMNKIIKEWEKITR